MWIKFLLWAILIGSIVMGYLGYQTGSATNAAIGIGIFIIGAFALFFILKLFLKLGFFVVKIILIFALIAIIILSGIKGCQYLVNKGNQVNQTQTEKSIDNDKKDSFSLCVASLFSVGGSAIRIR